MPTIIVRKRAFLLAHSRAGVSRDQQPSSWSRCASVRCPALAWEWDKNQPPRLDPWDFKRTFNFVGIRNRSIKPSKVFPNLFRFLFLNKIHIGPENHRSLWECGRKSKRHLFRRTLEGSRKRHKKLYRMKKQQYTVGTVETVSLKRWNFEPGPSLTQIAKDSRKSVHRKVTKQEC